MLAVIVGVLGALIYGSADFIGGIASKRISALRVTAIGGISGLVLLLIALPIVGGAWSSQAVLLGVLSGISGAAAITLLYACLAIGPMSILSPTTAVVSAIVPVVAGLVRGEQLKPVGYVALVIALIAVVLVGFVPEKGAVRPSLKALGMAVLSGALIGLFLIIIDLTPDDSGLVPLIFNRAVNAVIMMSAVGILAFVAWRRRSGLGASEADGGRASDAAGAPASAACAAAAASASAAAPAAASAAAPAAAPVAGAAPALRGGWRPGLLLAIIGGAIDATANAVLLLGLRLGELTIQSVLTALYPAGTIILAAVVLKERIAPVQIVGLALAIVAASMLALA